MAEQVKKDGKSRFLAVLLTVSASGFAAWQVHEGLTTTAVIPTKGDVPTIGHGSTRYEDGRKVKMGDTITRERAAELARNLMDADARKFSATIPGVYLTQGEFDLYNDFVGQYGLGNWRASSMRRNLLRGDYVAACQSLLKWRKAAGYDCSTLVNGKPNKRCWGVWTRQLDRYNKCMGEQE
ncbi:glycoside hydrolase family protein [Novosphingobium mangrovi (ex Huang et al. 2023)]|uniref:Lysozyme n=1 Tax=Novosphingobium mangrovi (ex Huang et al. 2023) TaxID=2976432 RepID=A0ABT2I165_9SPHN|nr:glycoside hydrolase family protein [Novosphingobium mangrovi (ex Huang et al. 2023)]MCT2398541.1 glycoside hydrolase family protein [Novosphingobium mangrovi (ex Huang et al. 2023)]